MSHKCSAHTDPPGTPSPRLRGEGFKPTIDNSECLEINETLHQQPGNEGFSHNYHFTYEIVATFTYSVAAAQTFTFTGDDDVWVFFNDQLAVDLGGVHGAITGSVALNDIAPTFGMVDGGVYTMNFFFAERHTSESNFKFRTNFDMVSTPVPEPATLILAASALAAGVRRARKKTR